MAGGRDLLAQPVPALEPVSDEQGGQRERDQGGDPVADGETERALGADLVDGADEHPSGPGDRVLHLAAASDGLQDLGTHRLAVRGASVSPVLLGELAVGGGVEVEGVEPDAHLVGPQVGPGVEALGRLREGDPLPRRLQNAVQTHRGRATRLHRFSCCL